MKQIIKTRKDLEQEIKQLQEEKDEIKMEAVRICEFMAEIVHQPSNHQITSKEKQILMNLCSQIYDIRTM